ncbi:Gibberellin 2-beta-dioxygenase 8-like protein [Drosera capensis]
MSKSNPLSYPPLFRPHLTPPGPTHKPDPGYAPDRLPIIDPNHPSLALSSACRDLGIFRLINHGIPANLLNSFNDHVRRLFDLDFESKKELLRGDVVRYFWGTPALTSSGDAMRRGVRRVDWVEGFNVRVGEMVEGSGGDGDDPLVAEFRDLLEEYGRHMSRLARTIFEAMISSLGIDLQQHENFLDESTGLLRVYRYLPGSVDDEEVKGMEEHTDSSVLSILMPNEIAGLEFLKDDRWVLVEPVADSLIVNLGDMMQAMSNDEFKSVKHRVRLNRNHERISICYFVFPEESCLIRSSKYKPFSYNDFRAQVEQDIANLGCKVGLDRFKLPDQ